MPCSASCSATVSSHGEIVRPARLLAAMRHGVLNGGKRLRPFLVLESAALFGADETAALRVAAALECVHCYSLIHDDLPAMDDDDLRRGQPTVHKAFDEATAILAGDSLLTLAFDILADEATALAADRRAALVLALARAAGIGGMAGGQALDLEAETDAARRDGHHHAAGDEDRRADPLRLRGRRDRGRRDARPIASGWPSSARRSDWPSNSPTICSMSRRTPRRWARRPARTRRPARRRWSALHGEDWARRQLGGLVTQAHDLLKPYGAAAATLKAAASFVASRRR